MPTRRYFVMFLVYILAFQQALIGAATTAYAQDQEGEDPILTVIKTVINDEGGTKTVADFPLFVTENSATPQVTAVTSGVPTTFNPGNYTVSETANPSYDASVWGGDCSAAGNVTLNPDDNKICTITNDDRGIHNGGGFGGGGSGGGSTTPPPAPPSPPTPPPAPSPAPAPAPPSPPPAPPSDSGEVLGATTTNDIIPCGLFVDSYVKYGAMNDPENVKKLQRFLNSYMGLDLEVNGIYDRPTFNAVKKFQLKEYEEVLKPWGIHYATGYVYKTTSRRINMIMCHQLNIPMPHLP